MSVIGTSLVYVQVETAFFLPFSSFCFVFFLPLLIIIFCYIFIFRAIRETGR